MKIYILLDMRDKTQKIINAYTDKTKCLQERSDIAKRNAVDEKFFAIETVEVEE